MSEQTAGQRAAAELRRYFSVGPRSRRYRKGDDLHEQMIEMLGLASAYPGYYSEATHAALAGTYGAYASWTKHVDGYRVDGSLRFELSRLSPWRLAGLLGDMVDAGVTCTGHGERFFGEMARQMYERAA